MTYILNQTERMITWTPLKKGDLVDVIAPGSASSKENIHQALSLLKSWGLRVRVSQEMSSAFLYHSASDSKRFLALKKALYAKDSQAVWCIRGGYGSNRLMTELSKLKAPAKAKLFVGLSDITSIHLFLNTQWKWPTIHGPVLERLGRGNLSLQGKNEIHQLIFGDLEEVEFEKLKALNSAAKKMKSAKAKIIGGNLMTIQSSIGTSHRFSARGKFLFIEEIGERGYRVDRILYHLKDAKVLNGAKAILIGEFEGGDEPISGKSPKQNYVSAAIERFAKDLEIPVYQGLPVGHGFPQRSLPFGTTAILLNNSLSVKSGVKK